MKVRQMVLDTSDARGCVISIPLEIVGGMLPCQIVNRSRDLRWSKNFQNLFRKVVWYELCRNKSNSNNLIFCILYSQLQVCDDQWKILRLLPLPFLSRRILHSSNIDGGFSLASFPVVYNHLVRNSSKNSTAISCNIQVIFDHRLSSCKLKFYICSYLLFTK